jgi:hypothetical protein
MDLSVAASNPALVDNNSSTVWDAGAATGSFIIDVGAVRALNAIRIDWDGANGRRFNYRVTTSVSGSNFPVDWKSTVRKTYSNRADLTLDFFDEEARYVKVTVTGQSAGSPATARVREVEVFDAAPARTQYYLNNVSGSDTNTGLDGNAWRTFSYAKSRMRPRTELNFINTGVPYPGAMSLGPEHSGKHSNATIVYRGDEAVLTPINASGANQAIELNDTRYLEWTNFDMYAAASENVRVWAQDATTKIMHNRIHGAQGSYPNGRGIMGAGSFTLAYNLIYQNASDGMLLRSGDPGYAQIYNNVFYGNQVDGLVLENDSSVYPTVRNNISSGNAGAAFSRGSLGSVVDSHNCAAGTYVGAWQKVQSISGNPLFVNPSAGNFHLQAGSPCIDAGIDVDLYADFADNPINDEPSVPNTGSPGQYSRNFVDVGAVEVQPCDISACTNNGGGCH